MNDLPALFPTGSTTDSDGMLTVGGCRADTPWPQRSAHPRP